MAGNRWQRTMGFESDEAGTRIGSIEARLGELSDTAVKITGSPISIPEIDGTYTITFRRDPERNGVYVTMRFLIPAETQILTVKMIRTADRIDAATFRKRKFGYDIEDITDEERALQQVERELWAKNPLEYDTQYDVFRLAAHFTSDRTGVAAENPQVDVLYNDAPLAQFTTPQAFNVPSSPSLALITTALDSTTRAFDAYTEHTVQAPLTDAGGNQTWGDSGAGEVAIVLSDPDGNEIKIPHILRDTDLTQVSGGRGFVKITHKPQFPGALYTWVKNICWVNGQKRESSGASVQYRAANLVLDPTGLTSKSLSIVTNVDPYTPKSARVDLLFTNPASPNTVSLKNVTVERKLFGAADSTYQVIIKKFSLKDDEYSSAGAKTIVIGEGVVFKPSLTYELRVTIFAIGGSSVQFTTGAVSTGSNPDVTNDTAAPSGLSTPVLAWTAEGRLKVTNLQATTNIHTLKKKYIVLYNGSTTYYNFLTNAAAANEAAARFEVGLTGHIPLLSAKLKKLRSVFGTSSPTNVYAYWYAENDINVSSKSSDSNAVDLTSIYDHQGDRDTIRGLDVESTLTSPGNIFGNGDWILVNVDEQYNWARWDGLTTPLPAIGTGTGSGAYRTVRLTSTEISYVESSHSGWFKANTSYQLLQNVKQRFLPGEAYALTMFLRADTPITVTIKLHLYNLERPVLTGTANLTSSTAVVGTGTLFTTEVQVGDQIVIGGTQKRTVATITDDTHLSVTSAFSAASGAINIIIDNINDTLDQSLNLTTTNQYFGAIFSMKTSPNLASVAGGTDYARHQFGIEFTSNTDDVYVDKNMCIRGEQPMAFAPRGDEVDSLSSSTVNPTFISAPDVVTISGTDGGWLVTDSAGFISIQSV